MTFDNGDKGIDKVSDGWIPTAKRIESPNCDRRPDNIRIDLLVIHNISLPPAQYGGGYIQQFFCNQLDCHVHPYFQTLIDLKVSAHCLIERGGALTQFVSFEDRAWHAGESSFEGRNRCNDFSIGIELEGVDDEAYTSAQYQSLVLLTCTVMAAYPDITRDRIVGHCDIAPQRKTDPGPAFDWNRYRNLLP